MKHSLNHLFKARSYLFYFGAKGFTKRSREKLFVYRFVFRLTSEYQEIHVSFHRDRSKFLQQMPSKQVVFYTKADTMFKMLMPY